MAWMTGVKSTYTPFNIVFATMLISLSSSLFWPPEPYHPTEPEAPEDIRKRELIYTDPVHQINLVAFVREHLQQVIQQVGGEQAFQEEWLSRVDKEVLKGFGELGIM